MNIFLEPKCLQKQQIILHHPWGWTLSSQWERQEEIRKSGNWRRFILAIRNNGLQYEDGKWNSWVVLNQLWNCNLQQHFGHYEYWTVTQKWINFLNCNFGTLRFWTTFLGLECFYGHSNSKMSNQKTKHILFLLLRILDCKDKDEKWNSWILLHHL